MEDCSRLREPFVDIVPNLSELLALDRERSSDMYHSGQPAAEAPAPGPADGTRNRRQSLEDCLSPTFSSQPANAPSASKSWQTIHQKYSDIFAPLDFSASKRDSLSSTDSSFDLEPTSVGTGGSVLTLDTYFESEESPSPPPLRFPPRLDSKEQISWLDCDDVVSPISLRRRSSMFDFPSYIQQHSRCPTEADTFVAMSPRSSIIDVDDEPVSPFSGTTLVFPSEIPERRSSLNQPEAYTTTEQLAEQLYDQKENSHDFPLITSTTGSRKTTSQLRSSDDTATPSVYSTHKETMASKSNTSAVRRGPPIASAEVGFEEWLESDMAQQFACGDQVLPLPLPATVQEKIKYYVMNFPEPTLLCSSLLVDSIRNLSHRVRYNIDSPAMVAHQPSHQQHHKLPKWKWLSSSSTEQQARQEQSDLARVYNRQEWFVMRNIFPHGSDGLCEALYAYVLVYNYITSLCLRSPVHAKDLSRPTTPWGGSVPDKGMSTSFTEPDAFGSASLRPPISEKNAVPRKAASILGLADEDAYPPVPTPRSLSRPSSKTNLRATAFTGLRGKPSLLFNGTSQGQRRGESKDNQNTRPTTPAVSQNVSTQPGTPESGGPGIRSKSPAGLRGTDQARQLAELRRGVARCCARLTVTLHRADPKITKRKDDKEYKVDPSFMRSLCEIVRATEDTIGRCQ
ncbi:hypothetical protein GGS21DRAFT_493080 [Xylaria nigripes]|nr:hypothetical protein GGS21DRAFT_493080 [Xylaria nigripes]